MDLLIFLAVLAAVGALASAAGHDSRPTHVGDLDRSLVDWRRGSDRSA